MMRFGIPEIMVILATILIPVLIAVIVAVVAYWIIRKAVCAGILDAKKRLNEGDTPTL